MKTRTTIYILLLIAIVSCDLLSPNEKVPHDVRSRIEDAMQLSLNKQSNTDTLFQTSYPVYFVGDTLRFYVEFTDELKIRGFDSKISMVYTDYQIPPLVLFEKSYPEFKGKKSISLSEEMVLPSSIDEFSDEGNVSFVMRVAIEFEKYPGSDNGKSKNFWVLPCEEFPNHCTNVNED